MKILILGGTQFVGRRLVEMLKRDSAHEITLFNRGTTNPDLFADLARITGDRDKPEDVQKIAVEHWDCVIDISCYFPHQVRYVLQALGPFGGRYIFVSSVSVYRDLITSGDQWISDGHPVLSCAPDEMRDESPQTYGKRKAECERIVLKDLPHAIVLRPAMIVGRYDPTDRLYYWLYRIKKAQRCLVPEHGENGIPLTFVDDFCWAIIRLLHHATNDRILNASTLSDVTINDILSTAANIVGRQVSKVNVDSQFLKEQQLKNWSDLPLWIGNVHVRVDSTKLKRQLALQPALLAECMQSCIAYYHELGWPIPSAGISMQREQELLELIKTT